jgi:transcriptional regulator of acetoin/glycerol metabolism
MAIANDRESLAAELERHVKEEGEILQEYRTFSDKLAEGPLSILVDHIVTEEEMHHFLLRTMSEWLQAPPASGESLAARGIDRDEILSHTQTLQEHEKKTIMECRALKSRLSGEEGDLFETLLEAIALDSEKHQRLLAAVVKLIG